MSKSKKASSEIAKYAVFGLILVVGVILNDVLSNRWTSTVAVADTAKRVHEVPKEIGDWKGVDKEPLTQRVLEVAGIVEYVSRHYTNQQTRDTMHVMLVCGRPGPIAVHPPNICFQSTGYVFSTAPKTYGVSISDQEKAEFKLSTPHKRESTYTSKLRVLWSWSGTGEWLAPDMPRVTFATQSLLYKLYVVSESSGDVERDREISDEFVTELIPEINKALFAG